MSSTTHEDRLLVDDVVAALTNCPEAESTAVLDLREQMQRAADEFDRRTAETFARALVDSLCEDPADVRRLEALLILGLAHPHILDKYQVSLAAEGRRLCVLLENSGEAERARSLLELLVTHVPDDRSLQQDLNSMMRRAGAVEELIELCLQRADEAVQLGKPMDAIPWLQEILLHDQSRRDVARMIRDLRYQEMANLVRRKRRHRLSLVLIVVSTVITTLFVREHHISEQYGALPPVDMKNISTINARLAGIDALLTDNRVWAGMFAIVEERSELQLQKDRLEASLARQERERIQRLDHRRAMAEAARLRGLDYVDQGDFLAALGQFRRSLDLSAPDWDRRARVTADVAAIEKLLEGDN